MTNPSICLIVPMRGDADYLERCLSSFVRLTYSPLEIILVDDGMTDAALQKAARSPGIRVLKSDGTGPSHARNLAARQTDAELLGFTDSDCIADPDWLDRLREGLGTEPDVAACGGRQLLPDDATPFQARVFTFLQRMGIVAEYLRAPGDAGIVPVRHNPSCNVLYRRRAFLEAGGFPGGLWPGEDVALDYRLTRRGYRLLHNPAAIVYHYRPRGVRSFARWMWRYGLAQGWLVRHFGAFRWVHLAPSVLLFLVALVLSCAATGHLGAAAVLLTSLTLALWVWLRFDVAVLLLTVVAGLAWTAGFVGGFLRPRPLDHARP